MAHLKKKTIRPPNKTQKLEIQGDILQSVDSIAPCISNDFKLGAAIAHNIKPRFPVKYPNKEIVVGEVI